MENVPQLLGSNQYAKFAAAARAEGFVLSAWVLQAADYGVPQLRRRAMVIGSKLGLVRHPVPLRGPDSAGGIAHRTVREALIGLSPQPDGSNWHRPRLGVSDLSKTRYTAVPKDGGNRFQMQSELDARGLAHLVPMCWRANTTGTTDVFGRMFWDRPAPTIRTEFFKPEKGRYLHPEEDRAITAREAARLQSFPDSFRFPDEQPLRSIARQIGNAVPPLLAEAIGNTILPLF